MKSKSIKRGIVKRIMSLTMAIVMTICFVPGCSYGAADAAGADSDMNTAVTTNGTDDVKTAETDEVKEAGASALKYLKGKQDKILDEYKNAKYTILASYYPGKKQESVTIELENCGFTYDNALAALAFISAKDSKRAAYILDSFVYALGNDRSGEVKLRNAYRYGSVEDNQYGALLPGFWKWDRWNEDSYQVGTNLGNSSWAAIAMLQYDNVFGTDKYLNPACRTMDYVLENFKTDNYPGITSGYDGWKENNPPEVSVYTYKSTECNLDAAVAFRELYRVTSDKKYKDAYEDCVAFARSMYVSEEKRFVVGTTGDGITKNEKNTFLDCIAWPMLALPDELSCTEDLADSIVDMTTEGGLPFVSLGIPADRKFESGGGIWHEGCIFGSMALKSAGRTEKADEIMNTLLADQDSCGAFTSASKTLFADNTWRYGCIDFHIAPTAWMVMYANDFNPFAYTGKDKPNPATQVKGVIPAKPTKVKITKGKKSLRIKWAKPSKTKMKNITGYQIRYSIKSNMKKAKTVTVSKEKTTVKIKNLKKKTKYYIQMRSINADRSSAWTSKKAIRL